MMTLEELKAEAEKLGYTLEELKAEVEKRPELADMKDYLTLITCERVEQKPALPDRLLRCTCGSKKYWLCKIGCGENIAYYVKCRKCGKEGPRIDSIVSSGCFLLEDTVIRLAEGWWNEMIREEMTKGEKNDVRRAES